MQHISYIMNFFIIYKIKNKKKWSFFSNKNDFLKPRRYFIVLFEYFHETIFLRMIKLCSRNNYIIIRNYFNKNNYYAGYTRDLLWMILREYDLGYESWTIYVAE